jgi:hypothetical protein
MSPWVAKMPRTRRPAHSPIAADRAEGRPEGNAAVRGNESAAIEPRREAGHARRADGTIRSSHPTRGKELPMRIVSLAAAAVVAGLLAPALAAAQEVRADNRVGEFSINVSLFNQNDGVMIQPCSSTTVGFNQAAIFTKTGLCANYNEFKVRVSAFNFSNQPSCWAYNVPWGATVEVTGGSGGISCTKK